jgi:hypothetical protein
VRFIQRSADENEKGGLECRSLLTSWFWRSLLRRLTKTDHVHDHVHVNVDVDVVVHVLMVGCLRLFDNPGTHNE